MPRDLRAPTSTWRRDFREADRLPESAGALEKRARGRRFERILSAGFEEAGLRPRLSYRPKGEEIDGSIWFEGRTILVEAKWTREPHPASTLYQFRGKVDGKLVGTLGLFISMAGVSADAVDALVAGKNLTIVLADGDDVRAVVNGVVNFRQALELKLRAAGDTGTPFVPLSSLVTGPVRSDAVFVEGRFDARLLRIVREMHGVTASGPIVPAAGPLNMVPLMNAVLPVSGGPTRVTMVLDDASVVGRLKSEIALAADTLDTDAPEIDVVALPMPLESALGLVKADANRADRRRLWDLSNADIKEQLRDVDLEGRSEVVDGLRSVLQATGIDL